jgi:2-phospho-L-lactate/phosphoenolpyruvate guanylyltransferase
MQVVIPCKAFDLGKSRLAPCLEPVSRQELCRSLFVRTLDLAMRAFSRQQICVVTNDADAIALARSLSIDCVIDPGQGLNEGLEAARRDLLTTTRAAGAMLVLPIDLPYADEEVVLSFCELDKEVVIAPDEAWTGTNLLRLRGRALTEFVFEFGEGSYERHLAQAKAKRLSLKTIADWRLGFDIDGPAQYSNWTRCRDERRLVEADRALI